MLVGEKPFAAEDTLSLLAMHRAAPIPRLANHLDGELPDGLQEIVDRAMAKAPGDRFQTAIELADAIDAVTSGRAATDKPVQVKRATNPSMAIAPTLLDVGQPSPATSRTWRRPLLGAVILLGGVVATAGYLIHRAATDAKTDAPLVAVAPGDAAQPLGSAVPVAPEDAATAPLADAEEPPPSSDATPAVAEPADAAPPVEDAIVAVAVADDAAVGEIEMDPAIADDPDPAAPVATKHVDEAPDAPKTDKEIETRAPVAPALAPTVAGAIQQIKDGNRPLALASLRALSRSQPASAYIPFLLGNLYFDERWWSVAMDHYRKAIMKNAAYKSNPVINRNVIQMLASPKTQSFAYYFLRTTIGRPALPYVKIAAAHSDNPIVKKQAAILAKQIH
jgi:serine/threonine-protein kinase